MATEKTPLEQAQELLSMDPLPEDVDERLAALEAQANSVERDYFADLWESVTVAEVPQPR